MSLPFTTLLRLIKQVITAQGLLLLPNYLQLAALQLLVTNTLLLLLLVNQLLNQLLRHLALHPLAAAKPSVLPMVVTIPSIASMGSA